MLPLSSSYEITKDDTNEPQKITKDDTSEPQKTPKKDNNMIPKTFLICAMFVGLGFGTYLLFIGTHYSTYDNIDVTITNNNTDQLLLEIYSCSNDHICSTNYCSLEKKQNEKYFMNDTLNVYYKIDVNTIGDIACYWNQNNINIAPIIAGIVLIFFGVIFVRLLYTWNLNKL